MKTSQVAAQLYTVRDFCKTPADIAATLKKTRAIGYTTVQVSGIGPIADDELAELLRTEGLTCCATHEGGENLFSDPQSIVARLKKLGCTKVAYPWPAGVNFDSLDSVKALAARLNAAGKALYEAGMTLSYHCHHVEFRRLAGKTALEILFDETDPRYLQAELDTYWVQYGGCDPVAWCQRLKNRLPQLHIKDFVISRENKIVFAEVGNGNLNWPAIIQAAESSGCQWFIVEQDTCPGDPFDSLKQSFDYIRKNLCSA